MTVSSSASSAQFAGNGTTTVFPLPFRFFDNGDVTAYLIDDISLSTTPLSIGVNYTLIGAGQPEVDGNPISQLTMLVAPPSGQTLVVERIMEAVQETDIINQARFYPEVHENVFDRLTMLIQQAIDRVSTSLSLDGARRYFDARGLQIKNLADPTDPQDATTKNYVDVQNDAQDVRIDALSAGLPGTNYAFPWSTTTTQSTQTLTPGYTFASATLAINGATQTYGKAYIVSGNQIILAEAIPAGTEVSAILGQSVVPSDLVPRSELAASTGASLVGFGSWTLEEKLNRMLDVYDFGAVGDGASHQLSTRYATLAEAQAVYPHAVALTDEIDWAAIQAAINAASLQSPVGYIYCNRGSFILNRQLVATKTIGIGGLGLEQTQLTWGSSSVSQGLSITYSSTSDKSHPLIENMSFVRNSAYGGSAIYINGATGGGHPDSFRGMIRNVRCDRATRGTGLGSWAYGIQCVNVAGMVIDGYSFQGDIDPVDPTRYYGIPWDISGPDGVNEVNSHFFVNNTFCVYAEYGGKVSNCEEFHLLNFTTYNVEYGLWYDNVGNYDENVVSPRIEIAYGHIKARRIGMYFKKAQASGISHVYSLHSNTDTPVGLTYKHVQLDGCLNSTVRDLKIEGLNGSTATGIELINSSFENVIEGINFFTSGGDAIHMDSTSQANYIGINAFRSSSWTRYLFNESLYTMYMHGVFILRTSAAVNFPNGSLTLPFDAVYRSDIGSGWADLTGAPTRITIRKRGKYRVTAHVRISAAAGGIRTAAIWQNGNSGIGLGRITTAAAPTGDTWLSIVSDTLTLNVNDYLTLYLEQTSGGTLTVASGTVLGIEFLGAC